MNSKPTDKSNVENSPPQDEPPADNPPADDPPVEDPPEDDPVPSLDSSVDSDEFKCKHCEVDPFPNENELKQHIKLKHEIKVSGSKSSTFRSREECLLRMFFVQFYRLFRIIIFLVQIL